MRPGFANDDSIGSFGVDSGWGPADGNKPGPNYNGQATMQTTQASSGIPYPIAYGYARAVGNLRLLGELPDKSKVAFVLLGIGEWDGIERFWIRKRYVSPTATDIIHFHPGVLPAIGGSLTPSSNGGDNNVDNFFALLPANIQRVSFSRVAYVAFQAFPDPQAPSADVDWLGDYRTLKVRIFDAGGALTSYQFSTNPIWQWLDLRFRLQLFREGLAGEDPPTAVKNRIDFAAAVDAAATCDALIGGKKRFQNSCAFTDTQSLGDLENKILLSCRGYVIEPNGKLQVRVDQVRAATFSLSQSHVKPLSASFSEKNIRGAKNRIIATFRDLNPSVFATIVSIASGPDGIVIVQTSVEHGLGPGSHVDISGTGVAGWDGKTWGITDTADKFHFRFVSTVYSTAATQGAIWTPESRFAERAIIVDHTAHQLASGARGVGLALAARENAETIDFGVSTFDQVSRLCKYILYRRLGPDATPYKAPVEGKIDVDLYAVDSANRALLAHLPGDAINVDNTVSDEFTGDYELIQRDDYLDAGSSDAGDGSAGVTTLSIREVVPEAFTDTADEEPTLSPVAPPQGLGVHTIRVIACGGSVPTPSSVMYYDGVQVAQQSTDYAYIVVVIDRISGQVESVTKYLVYTSAADALAMANALNALGDYQKIVGIFVYGESQTNRLTNGLPAAMERCGASKVFSSVAFKYGAAYILVGYPGAGLGNGLEMYKGSVDLDATAKLDMSVSVVNGNIQGQATSVPSAFTVDEMPDGSTFKKLRYVGGSGQIIASTALNPQGSLIPNQAVTINIAWTDTTIVLTWSAQNLLRPDTSVLVLQAGSASYSGLTPSTSYKFYGRINVSTGVLAFLGGSPPPTSADPTLAIQCNYDGYTALSPMTVSTISSGSGGGSGGDPRCPEQDERIRIMRAEEIMETAARDAHIGDLIEGWSFRQQKNVWRRISMVALRSNLVWRRINGKRVTPCEPVRWQDKWMPAFRVPGSQRDLLNSKQVEITVDRDEYDECNYWLIGGDGEPLLIHNLPVEC